MTKSKHNQTLKTAFFLLAVFLCFTEPNAVSSESYASFSPAKDSVMGFVSPSISNQSLSEISDKPASQDDTTGIVCPEDISIYTDLNSCVAVISNGLDISDPNGIISTLSWEMTGATEAASNGSGINQIGSYTFNKGTTVITYRGATLYNNSINCTFTVTVSDNQVPRLISSPGHITVRNLSGECYANVSWTEPSAADNCVPQDQLIYTSNYNSGQQFPVGSTLVEYRISDGVNTAVHSFTVTVTDAEAPQLIAPPDSESECGQPVPDAFTTWEQFEQAGGSANDNCSVNYGSFRYVGQTSSGITCPYKVTRTYSISDDDGNVSEVKHVIEVTGEGMAYEATHESTEPEVLLEPGAETQAEILFSKTDVSCKGSRTGMVDLTVNGTSGIVSFVWSTQNGSGIVQGAEDQSTLSDGDYTVMVYENGVRLLSFDFSILVSDNQAPVLNAPATIQRDCGQSIPAAYSTWSEFANAGGTVRDNCQIYYSSFRLASESKSNPDCPYTLTRVYEITDVNGNRGLAEHIINVEADEVILKSGMGTAGLFVSTATGGNWNDGSSWDGGVAPGPTDDVEIVSGATITLTDNRTAVNITNNGTLLIGGNNLQIDGNLINNGTLTVGSGTITNYGNWTNNGTFTAGTGTVEFKGASNAAISGSSATTFNNFILNKGTDVTTELEINSVGAVSLGSYTFTSGLLKLTSGTYTLNSDFDILRAAGIHVNGATLTTGDYTITNEGLIRVTSGTANFGNSAGNSVHTQTDGAFEVSGVSTTVNIAGRLENSAGGTLVTGVPSGINISGGTINLATIGNGSSGTGALNVTQQGAFSFTAGTINIINANSTSGTAVDLAIAEVDGSGTKTITNGEFHFGDGTASTYHIVSAIDIPNITTSNQTELEITRIIDANGTYTFNLSDGNGNEIPVEITITADSYASDASIKVTTTDGKFANNESDVNYLSRYWSVDLTGITNPDYTFTADYNASDITGTESEIKAGAWNGSLPWTKGNLAAGNTISFNGLSGDLNITGITADNPTVTAGADQSTVCTGDDIDLTATPVGDAPFSFVWTGPNGFTSTDQNPTRTSATTAYAGEYGVTVTDGNGFTANATVTITVNTPPTFTTCPAAAIPANTIAGTCAANVNYTVEADGAPVPGLTYSFSGSTSGSGSGTGTGSSFDLGTTTVTVTATNSCGTATCSFDVVVSDNENPTISCVGNQSKDSDAGVCTYTVVGTEFDPTATGDNCGVASVVNDFNGGATLAGAVFPLGTTTVVWTITDNASNTATCSFDVVVSDNENPTISCVGNQSKDSDAGVCTYTVVGTEFDPTATGDNCGVASVVNDFNGGATLAGAVFPLGTTTVVWTITDNASNTATCSFDVVVSDNENPTISCIASYTATGNSACTGVINVAAPSYDDNCGVTSFSWTMSGATNDSGTTPIGTYTFSRGTTTIEYTVADAAGNEAKCSYQITIPDLLTIAASSDPVICQGDDLILSATPSGGTTNYTYSWTGPNGFTSTEQNPVINDVTTAESGSYSVTVTDNNNCTATAAVTVTVRPTPTATITGTTAVCQNEAPAPTVTFTNEMADAVVVTYNINGGGDITMDIAGNSFRSVTQPTGVAGTYVYNLVQVHYASGVSCANTDPSSVTITVHPTPTVNPISDVVYCNGQTVGSLQPTGPVSGTTFTWDNDNPAIGLGASGNGAVSAFTATNNTDAPINANITITPTANGCVGTPYTYTVTVNPTPRATITGTTTVCYEDAEPVITFHNPMGLALTVAYNINGSGTTYTIDVEANSTATITAPTTTPGTFNYNLVSAAYQSSPNCLIGISSQTATITVDPEPIADATPQNQTICSGNDITTIILGTTNGISGTTFSWTRNNTTSVTGIAASGSGDISGALTNTTALPVIVTFTITPEAAGCPGNPIQARVTVNPIPVATITDNNGSRCSGVTISEIVLTSTTPNTTFTWTRDNTDIVSGIPSPGSGSKINGALTNLTSAPVPVTFTVTPTANGCVGPSATTTITINPTPQINDTTLTICNSGSFDATPIDVINGVVPAGTSYDWNIQSNTGGVTGAVDGVGTSITGTLGNSSNTVQTVTYAVYPSYSGCLGEVFLVKVNVTPEPDINDIPKTVCSNQEFEVKPVNSTHGIVPSGTQYTWSAPSLPAGLTGGAENTTPAGSITGTLINTTKDPLTAIYTVSPSNGICSGADFEVAVTVNPAATVNASEINACSGSGFSFAPEHGVDGAIVPDGTTYSWSAPDMDAGVSGGTAGSGASTISGTLFNSGSTPLEARYTVTPVSAGCDGDPFVLTVIVDPLPAINPITKTICSGEPFTITPEDGTNGVVPAGTTYSWAAPTVTGGITGGQAGTDQTEISGILTNPTNTPRTATYEVIPTSGSCAGIKFNVIVTVNPTPAITDINTTVCSGTAFSIIPQNSTNGIVPSGTTYTWTAPSMPAGVSGGVANATPSSDINGTLTNSSSDAQVVTYVVSASAGTCGPTTFNVNVTVNPTPTATISGGGTVCDNAGTADIIFTNPMDLPVTISYNIDGGTNFTVDIPANDSETVPATINATGTFIYNLVNVAYQSSPDCSTPIVGQSVTLIVEPITTAGISADFTTICEGDIVTFTADTANAGTNPTLVWKVNGVTEQTGGKTFSSATLSNGDEVTFEVTTTAGTPCLGTTVSNIVTMTVNPLNVPSVTIYESANNICEGTSVTFTADPVVNGGPTPTFQWYLNGTTPVGSNSNTYTTTSLADGDKVTVVVSSSASCPGPEATSNEITMNVNPNLPVSVSISEDINSICEGTEVTFTATPTNGGSNPVYQWKVNGTNVGTNSPTFSTTTLQDNDIVTVVLTSNATCAVDNPATSNPITMEVNPNLPVSVSIAEDLNSVCDGTAVTFTATPTNGGSSPSYQWKVNGVDVGTDSPTFTSTTLSDNDVVTVVMTSDETCTSGNPATSNPVTMEIYPNLPVSVSIAEDLNSICDGTAVTFTATPTNGGSSPSYQWYLNGTTPVGTDSPTFTSTTLSDNDVVTVVMTSSETCTSDNPSTSNGITMTVNPILPVSVSIDADNNPVCTGTAVTYTATPTNGGSNPTYQWKVDGVNAGTNSATFVYTPNDGEIISVELTSDEACVSGNPATDAVTMTVEPLPTASAGGTMAICSDANYTLTAGEASAANGTIVWTENGAGSITAGANTLTPTYTAAAGDEGNAVTLTMTVTSNNSCGTATATAFYTINVDAPITATPEIPTGPQSVCSVASLLNYTVTAVPNATGYDWNLPGDWVITTGAGTNTISVDISAASEGIYYVSVIATNACGSSLESAGLEVSIGDFATANAGADQQICFSDASIDVEGTAGGAANKNVGFWTTSGSGTFSNIFKTRAIYTPSAADRSAGSVILTFTTDDPSGTCGAESDDLILTILPEPTASISVSGANPICSGSASEVTFTGTPNTTVTYTIDGGTSQTIQIDGSGSVSFATAALTANTVYNLESVEYTNAPACPEIISGSVTITVNPLPLVDAGSEATICADGTLTLAGSVSGGATAGEWTTSGDGTFDNEFALNAVYTPGTNDISTGSVTLTLSSTDHVAPCSVVSDDVIITIDPVATVNAGSPQTICEDADVSLNGSVGGAATAGTWSGGGGTFNPDNTTLNATYTPSAAEIAAGTVTLTLTTDDPAGPCNAVSADVVITINPVATVDAGSPQTICEGSDVSLNGSVGGAATSGTWSGGGGTFNPDNTTLTATYTPSAAEIAAGSVTLTLTTDDPAGPCDAVSADVVITINPVATVNAGSPQTICEDSDVILNGSVGGAATTGTWSGGTGTFSPNNTTLTATYTPSAAEIAAGTVTLTLTTDDPAGPCEAVSADVVITINPKVTVDPGTYGPYCSDETITLNGSITGGVSTGTWSGGAGTFSNNTDLNATYTPTGAEIAAGTVTLTLTSDNPAAPCGPVSESTTITIYRKVTITSQPVNTGVCVGNPTTLSVVASGSNLSYQWYKGSTPIGTDSPTLSFAAVTLADDDSYYVVVSGANECPTVQSSTVTLNVDAAITITTQPTSKTNCEGENVIFTVVAGANGAALTYQWRKDGVNISGATSSSYSLSNITSADAGVYDVVIDGAGSFNCNSITSSGATLTIGSDGTISDPANKDQTICEGDAIVDIVFAIGGSAGGASLSGDLPAGLTSGYNSSTNEFTISGTPTETGTYSYTVTTTGSTCVNPSISGTITINEDGTISLAGGNANPTLCINTPLSNITYSIGGGATDASITSGSLPAGVTGVYNSATGLFTISGTPTEDGIFNFTVTTSGAVCENPSLSGTITVQPDATISLDSGDPNQTVCINTPITPITYSGGGSAGTLVLTGQLPAGVSFTESGGVYTISGTPSVSGTFNYTVNTTGSCLNVSESGSITIDNLADPGILSPAISTTCTDTFGENTGILTLIDYVGNIVQWEASYDGGQTWDTIPHTGASYTYNNLPNTTLFSVLVQNGTCDPFYSAVARVTVIPSFKPVITQVGGNACSGEPVTLYGTVDVVADTFSIIAGGHFNTANPKGWRIWQDSVILHPFPASGDNEKESPFAETNGPKEFCGELYDAGTEGKKFAIVHGEDMYSWMETPIFELLSTMSSAELTFDHAYNIAPGAWAKVELSLDGGDTYGIELASYTGKLNDGAVNVVNPIELDLSPYIGMDNLRIRFNFNSPGACSAWAIDNITLPSPPPDVTYVWGPVEEIPLGVTGSPVVVYPGTSTTYTLTMYIAGCPGSATDLLVFVYEYPVVQTVNACVGGGDVTFTMTDATEGGTWTVSGGGTITNDGVFTPTTPGCYVATYETPSGGCTGSANFVVFPQAPTPTVNAGCGPIVVTPPPTVDGFNIEYNFGDGNGWRQQNIPPTAHNCSPGYSIQVRYVTADLCDPTPVGNVSENTICSESPAVIRPIDLNPPTFTVPSDKIISKDANCDYDASVSVTGDVTDEADDCATSGLNATYTDVVLPGDCEGEEIITRTWTLTDDCGNTTTKKQTITVLDNEEPPTFTAPADITIYKDANCNYNASPSITGDVTDESDNCSTGLEALYSDATSTADNCGTIIITRTWTLTDNCGNVTSKDQFITIMVNIPPVITCPADIIVECIDDVPAADINAVTITDICGQVTITHEGDESDGNTCPEVITRTYKATDVCGLYSVTCTQKITINDTTDPVISPEASNGISDCDAEDPATNADFLNWLADHGGARATDNCDTDLDWTDNRAGQTWVRSGIDNTITVTFTVTDDCGNFAETTASFTVRDDVPPTLTCPVSSDAANPDLFEDFVSGDGCSKLSINVPDPTIYDICGIDRLVYTLSGATTGSSSATGINYVSDAELNVGITTVTYTLYDIAGNSAECTIRIWIKNIDQPRFDVTCPDATASDISVSAETDLCDAEVTVPAPVIDNFCVESFTVS
ncbi:PKD-like domain-containing protein, partial [Draconibacterium mangrovi]|uniref:PKD-like domain-containing protein n=1 Tax=Draconibacterium mangrovi TaxID=2697469 RepID=UPI0013D7177F